MSLASPKPQAPRLRGGPARREALDRAAHVSPGLIRPLVGSGWRVEPLGHGLPDAMPGDVVVLSAMAGTAASAATLRRWSLHHPLVPVVVLGYSGALEAGDCGWLQVVHPAALRAALDELHADPARLPGLGAHHLAARLAGAGTVAARALAILVGGPAAGPTLKGVARHLDTSSSVVAHATRREAGCTWRSARSLRATALLLGSLLWRRRSVASAAEELGVEEHTARRLLRRAGWQALLGSGAARQAVRSYLIAERRRRLGRPPMQGLSSATSPGLGRVGAVLTVSGEGGSTRGSPGGRGVRREPSARPPRRH